MDRFLENLKYQAEQNPVLALGVAAAAVTSISKLINAAAWKQEVNRRTRKSK